MFICSLVSLHFIPREKCRILLKPLLERVSSAVTQKVYADMFGARIWGVLLCARHHVCSSQQNIRFSLQWLRGLTLIILLVKQA